MLRTGKLNLKKIGTIIFVLIVALVAPVLVFLPAYEFFLWTSTGFNPDYRAINRCIDKQKGCWDKTLKICRVSEANIKNNCPPSEAQSDQ